MSIKDSNSWLLISIYDTFFPSPYMCTTGPSSEDFRIVNEPLEFLKGEMRTACYIKGDYLISLNDHNIIKMWAT